jgi:hypothetical protein
MPQRRTILALTAALALSALAAPSEAGRKAKRLRAELAELRARVAQLESQARFLVRRDAPGVVPVGGLCVDPCAFDSDADGIGDCIDACPCDPLNADRDGDGRPDCVDPCPDDAADACIDPCRTDSDGDGTPDCEDPCPYDPAPGRDTDRDGVPDCADPCPEDRTDGCVLPCPLDSDGDGTRDCTDPCPWGTAMPCLPPPPPPPPGECRATGCSGQLCADRDLPSTCEWRAAYACYRTAQCARQADGRCGWTPTEALRACLAAASGRR